MPRLIKVDYTRVVTHTIDYWNSVIHGINPSDDAEPTAEKILRAADYYNCAQNAEISCLLALKLVLKTHEQNTCYDCNHKCVEVAKYACMKGYNDRIERDDRISWSFWTNKYARDYPGKELKCGLHQLFCMVMNQSASICKVELNFFSDMCLWRIYPLTLVLGTNRCTPITYNMLYSYKAFKTVADAFIEFVDCYYSCDPIFHPKNGRLYGFVNRMVMLLLRMLWNSMSFNNCTNAGMYLAGFVAGFFVQKHKKQLLKNPMYPMFNLLL